MQRNSLLGITILYWYWHTASSTLSLSDSIESYDPLLTVQSVDPLPPLLGLMCLADWPHLDTWDTFITFLQTMSRMNLTTRLKNKIQRLRYHHWTCLFCVSLFESGEKTQCGVSIVCIIQTGIWTTPPNVDVVKLKTIKVGWIRTSFILGDDIILLFLSHDGVFWDSSLRRVWVDQNTSMGK